MNSLTCAKIRAHREAHAILKEKMMKIEMLYAKIHNATVTDANLAYKGSISIDRALLKKANLRAYQKVEIANLNNGERFATYIIEAPENSRTICINGAAARKVAVGDRVIIMAYAHFEPSEAEIFAPKIIILDAQNRESSGGESGESCGESVAAQGEKSGEKSVI